MRLGAAVAQLWIGGLEPAAMESPLLEVLADADRRRLVAASRRRRFRPKEVVFHEGDPGDSLHIVLRGHLAVRITTPMGDTATIRIVCPGEWFGELAVIVPGPRNATVMALDQVETLNVSQAILNDLTDQQPAFREVVTEALVMEVRRTAAALVEALYVPAEKRVIRRLLDLATAFGDDAPATTLPVTQEDVAQLAGVTRETANRLLKRHADDGLLALSRGKIELLDAGILERVAR